MKQLEAYSRGTFVGIISDLPAAKRRIEQSHLGPITFRPAEAPRVAVAMARPDRAHGPVIHVSPKTGNRWSEGDVQATPVQQQQAQACPKCGKTADLLACNSARAALRPGERDSWWLLTREDACILASFPGRVAQKYQAADTRDAHLMARGTNVLSWVQDLKSQWMTEIEEERAAQPEPDFNVSGDTSVALVRPLSAAASNWLDMHVNPAQWWAGSLVVEPRYLADLIAGMEAEGLVRG